MKRPQLVHFLSLITDEFISVKASVSFMEKNPHSPELGELGPTSPIQQWGLLKSDRFHIRFIGRDKQKSILIDKVYESDKFGNFSFKVPYLKREQNVEIFDLYETKAYPGVEIYLGTFMPMKIIGPKKVIICDFDKTLVDTKYSTTREVYKSLTSPLDSFPTVVEGLKLLKEFQSKGHQPFIVSASPHFYEGPIRDWLYQNQIFTAGVFLKDYRDIFAFWEGQLSTHDIKNQGHYKLNQLLDVLLMTGIPDELVLIGDNFESDPIIYLAMALILKDTLDPFQIWKIVQNQKGFILNKRQRTKFLTKIYQLHSQIKNRKANSPQIQIQIFIRKKKKEDQILIPDAFKGDTNLITPFS